MDRSPPEPTRPENAGVDYDGHDLEALSVLENYQRWICERLLPYLGDHAVEFGAGLGAMSQQLLDRAQRLDLVEPSVNLLPRLKTRFADDPRVNVFADTVATYSSRCTPESRDSVVLINVLEHIEDDREAMRDLARIVRPGGHALIYVPALPVLYSALDSQLGHFRRYTRTALASAVEATPWQIVEMSYFDLLGVVPWWIINTVGGKCDFNPRMAKIYDRVCVPVTRTLETVVAPPFGKNLLLVAVRGD
jgi:SAM-dependent methyltransferase